MSGIISTHVLCKLFFNKITCSSESESNVDSVPALKNSVSFLKMSKIDNTCFVESWAINWKSRLFVNRTTHLRCCMFVFAWRRWGQPHRKTCFLQLFYLFTSLQSISTTNSQFVLDIAYRLLFLGDTWPRHLRLQKTDSTSNKCALSYSE